MGWVAWAAATFFVFYQLVVQNSYAALDGTLREALNLDVADSSIVSATFLVVYGLMQVPAGMIIDRLGPGRVLPVAAIVLAGLTWAFSFADGMWSAVLLRGLMGLFAAFAFPGAGLIARRRLPVALFPLAMGFIDGVFGVGLWAGDVGVAAMIEAMHWRSVMAILGLGGVVAAIFCFVCIPPIGPSERPPDGSVLGDIRRLLGDKHIRQTAFVYAMLSGITFGFAGLWNVPLQEAWGFSHKEAMDFNGWIFIGLAIGAPVMGALGMRVAWRRPLLVGGVWLALAGMLFLLFAPSPTDAMFLDIVHGLVGIGVSAGILCFPIGCRDVEPARVATAIGMINAAGLLAAACFQIIPGVALSTSGSPGLVLVQVVLSIFVMGLIAAIPVAFRVTRHAGVEAHRPSHGA
jgi:MFS family permease